MLKQPQFDPMPFEKQTVSIFAGTNGYLDDVAVSDVLRWEAEMLDTVERKTEILTVIRETQKLEDDVREQLE
ncbi:F0F1 ATP synthase subunit alpha, partial [Acinetobacter baumannii]